MARYHGNKANSVMPLSNGLCCTAQVACSHGMVVNPSADARNMVLTCMVDNVNGFITCETNNRYNKSMLLHAHSTMVHNKMESNAAHQHERRASHIGLHVALLPLVDRIQMLDGGYMATMESYSQSGYILSPCDIAASIELVKKDNFIALQQRKHEQCKMASALDLLSTHKHDKGLLRHRKFYIGGTSPVADGAMLRIQQDAYQHNMATLDGLKFSRIQHAKLSLIALEKNIEYNVEWQTQSMGGTKESPLLANLTKGANVECKN